MAPRTVTPMRGPVTSDWNLGWVLAGVVLTGALLGILAALLTGSPG